MLFCCCKNLRTSNFMWVMFRPTCRIPLFSSVSAKSKGYTDSGPTCFFPIMPWHICKHYWWQKYDSEMTIMQSGLLLCGLWIVQLLQMLSSCTVQLILQNWRNFVQMSFLIHKSLIYISANSKYRTLSRESIPHRLLWHSIATNNAEASSVLAHCACPLEQEGCIQVWVMSSYRLYAGSACV